MVEALPFLEFPGKYKELPNRVSVGVDEAIVAELATGDFDDLRACGALSSPEPEIGEEP